MRPTAEILMELPPAARPRHLPEGWPETFCGRARCARTLKCWLGSVLKAEWLALAADDGVAPLACHEARRRIRAHEKHRGKGCAGPSADAGL